MLCRSKAKLRQGAAAVEAAVLAPFLGFVFIVGVDFARVYYYSLIVTYASRDGAVYASYSKAQSLDTDGIRVAAIKDSSSISPAPTVSVAYGSANSLGINGARSDYSTVTVTVTYTYRTVARYFIPSQFNVPSTYVLVRSTTMRISPDGPSS